MATTQSQTTQSQTTQNQHHQSDWTVGYVLKNGQNLKASMPVIIASAIAELGLAYLMWKNVESKYNNDLLSVLSALGVMYIYEIVAPILGAFIGPYSILVTSLGLYLLIVSRVK